MILLSVVSIMLNTKESINTAIETQADELRVIEMIIESNNEHMKKLLLR